MLIDDRPTGPFAGWTNQLTKPTNQPSQSSAPLPLDAVCWPLRHTSDFYIHLLFDRIEQYGFLFCFCCLFVDLDGRLFHWRACKGGRCNLIDKTA